MHLNYVTSVLLAQQYNLRRWAAAYYSLLFLVLYDSETKIDHVTYLDIHKNATLIKAASQL